MGRDLSFGEKSKKRFGACGPDLGSLIGLHFPSQFDASHPDIPAGTKAGSAYLVWDPSSYHTQQIKDVPAGESGYAVMYRESERPMTREELTERLEKLYTRHRSAASNSPEEQEQFRTFINSRVERHFDGSAVADPGLMLLEEDCRTVTESRFVRWVSKEEYKQKTAEAQRMLDNNASDDDVWVLDRWYFGRTHEEQRETCSSCDFNMHPSGNDSVDRIQSILAGLGEDEQHRLLRELCSVILGDLSPYPESQARQLLPDSQDAEYGGSAYYVLGKIFEEPSFTQEANALREHFIESGISPDPSPGCSRGSTYSHWGAFHDFLTKAVSATDGGFGAKVEQCEAPC